MVPISSSSENPSTGEAPFLGFLDSRSSLSVRSRATDITLEGQELVHPGAARMTFIVLMGGLREASLRVSRFACPCWLLEWCRRCLNFPSQTSWSKWYFKFLQFSVVCPDSWWYFQYRLWLRFAGSPAILFGHLNNGSFFTFSKTWCIGSRNTTCTACQLAGLDCPVKSPLGRLLLNRSDRKSLLSPRMTFALSFPSC